MIVLIVLNYNDSETVLEYINKIKDYESIDQILIVDNNSTDNSYSRLKKIENKKKITVIKTEINEGYACGNNYGVMFSVQKWNPEYIIISNPDVEFEEDVIHEMMLFLKKSKKVAAATVLMKCTSGIRLPIGWNLPTFNQCILQHFICLKKIIGSKNEYFIEDVHNKYVKFEAIPGSFFMVKADKFIEVGGFDHNTFLYNEENILGMRFKESNYEQYVITTHQYIHKHSVTINKNFKSIKKRLELSYNSRKYYCKEYLKAKKYQLILLKISFKIGTFNYLVIKSIIDKVKGMNKLS